MKRRSFTSDEKRRILGGVTVNNSSYHNMFGVWTSAARTVRIDSRSMTFDSTFFNYTVQSFNGYGYDVQMSNGEKWFTGIAGNMMSIESGEFAGAYRFSHS